MKNLKEQNIALLAYLTAVVSLTNGSSFVKTALAPQFHFQNALQLKMNRSLETVFISIHSNLLGHVNRYAALTKMPLIVTHLISSFQT